MSEWLKRINTLLDAGTIRYQEDTKSSFVPEKKSIEFNSPLEQVFLVNENTTSPPVKKINMSLQPPKDTNVNAPSNDKMDDIADDNIKALQKLRALPRGSETQLTSRIAAIKNLLGEKEIFKTLQILRWPKGTICPRCHSSQVVRRDPPPNAPDKRHYYECLACKGEGDPSDFDDFTGLPVGTLHGLRQWMLCWYLIGFCSISHIARVLGINVYEVTKIASFGSQITEMPLTPDAKAKIKHSTDSKLENQKKEARKQTKETEQQEDYTKSASKQPFKPGYKSKK